MRKFFWHFSLVVVIICACSAVSAATGMISQDLAIARDISVVNTDFVAAGHALNRAVTIGVIGVILGVAGLFTFNPRKGQL